MRGGWAGVMRRVVLAPAVVGLAALMGVTLPAWLIVALVVTGVVLARRRSA